MTTKQISVFVENKPGKLAEIARVLDNGKIDIRALSIADTTNFGILRLIVNDPQAAHDALKANKFIVSFTDVIAVSVADKPGGLYTALGCLADAGVAVEYMYAFITRRENTAYLIIRADNTEKAIAALMEKGIKIVSGKEIYEA